MLASHIVKDSAGNTAGYIIDGKFYTDYTAKENIIYIDNLTLTETGIMNSQDTLPEISYREGVNKQRFDAINKENPFIREIQNELLYWKNNLSHTVLQLEGTRQIGKTTELMKFAYSNYEYVIYIDMAYDRYDFLLAVNQGATPLEMEKYCVRAALPHFVNSKNTIIIIDEIQNSKEVYNSIRQIRSEVSCDIAVTGSYLGRTLKNSEFFIPAGTISYAYMFPMSFKEVCGIFDCDKLLMEIDLYGQSTEAEYEKLNDIYRLYLKIGGYPDVMKQYIMSKDINECYNAIRKLLNTFKDESRQYFSNIRQVEIFESVYREVLKEMCSEKRGTGKNAISGITDFVKSNTDLLVNKKEVAEAVVWLKYAGIIGTCNLAVDGDMRNIAPDRRVYFCDCGIASYLMEKSLIDETSLAGLLTETFVYNELHRLFKVPYKDLKVAEDEVCFSIFENYELDFMMADRNRTIYGIEVKTKSGDPLSLKVFVSRNLIDKGIVAKMTKGGHGDKFDTIPVYAVGSRFPYEDII